LKKIWRGEEHRRLVEPFAGGLSVALGLVPEKALLNDLNPHVINFYRHLKAGLVLDIHGGTSPKTYYSHRGAFNELIRQGRAIGMHDDGRHAAMLFYYLNRHCYNGLCRFNKKGEFNTPIGQYVHPKFDKDLRAYADELQNWDFTIADFADIPLGKGDFVYADPPYDNAYTGYAGIGFSYEDQERLARTLSKHEGPVLLSNHATPSMLDLYREYGFDISRRLKAPRMIQCFGDRTKVEEVLATLNVR
jgi:DNA adenine methylase